MRAALLRLALLTFCAAVLTATAQKPTLVRSKQGDVLLPNPRMLKAIGSSQTAFVSDFFWLRTLNITTGAATAEDGRLLLGLGNLITDLDPLFHHPYWVVGINAPVLEGSQWLNAREAAALLRRGLSFFPENVNLNLVLAYNLITYQRDFVGAAQVLHAFAAYPGVPSYVRPLVTRLLAAAGRFDASRAFAQEFEAAAEDEETRTFFRERLKLIDLEETLALVESAAQNYKAAKGSFPSAIAQLLADGYLPLPPVDPFGGTIELDSSTGKASSSVKNDRLVVHEE